MTSRLTPIITAQRRVLEVRAKIVDAPPLRSGKLKLNVYGVTIIYREHDDRTHWEFIHVTFNGVWIDGHKKGKTGHRRYGRSSMTSIPDWFITFINDNLPESENINRG